MSDNFVCSAGPCWKPPCQACGRNPCACDSHAPRPKQTEPVRISFRRAHKGSGMTIIGRLRMHPAGKDELLKKFKKKLGVGGTVKLGELELQGEHLDAVETGLKELGYKVKRLQ